MRKYIYMTLLLTCALSGKAQEQVNDSLLNRTVVVEQEYNPIIQDAQKINIVPQVEAPVASKHPVEYASDVQPASQIPASIMPNYTAREVQPHAFPGYLRMGYGNYGNLDLYANYLFSISPKDRLNLRLSMDGHDGKYDLPNDLGEWSSFYYRTRACVDYTHAFNRVNFNLAGNFGLSNFKGYESKNKFISGDVHLGVQSTDATLPVQFNAETNLMMYRRDFKSHELKEFLIRTKGDVYGALADEQQVGVAIEMNNFFNTYIDEVEENYTTLDLNPYYTYEKDAWKIRLGAHVDFSTREDDEIKIAPDLYVEYATSAKSALYLQAKGGRILNDLRRIESISPYVDINSTVNTYEQLNAALGFKIGTDVGFWMNLFAGYQKLDNDLCDVLLDFVDFPPMSDSRIVRPMFLAGDASNFYAGAEVKYDYKQTVGLNLSAVYRNWNAEDILCYFKPALQLDAALWLSPIKSLQVEAGYQHIARCDVEDAIGMKAESYSNLYAKAHYSLHKNVGIYVHLNNLLNAESMYYCGYMTQGFNFMGGITFGF